MGLRRPHPDSFALPRPRVVKNAANNAVKTDLTACEQFYGLRARPFSLTPDLRFAYHSRSHSRALEQVTLALRRREGLIVVTGEIGTGKTMLCRSLLETFEARTFLSVILDPLLTVEDLLHQVLSDFGLIARDEGAAAPEPSTTISRHQLIATLHKFLSSLIPLNAHAVIMIDEAQHLSPQVLEEVRLLSNFETDEAKLLQIVLVGQPDLEEILARPIMRQLNQRVARRFRLEPLGEAEVRDYVERRLQVASEADAGEAGAAPETGQGVRVRFATEAMAAVAMFSEGVPRVINTLCDRALEVGFESRQYIIDRDAVLEAANRLRLAVPSPSPRPEASVSIEEEPRSRSRFPRPAVAALAAAAVIAGIWLVTRPGVERQPPLEISRAVPPASPATPPSTDAAPPATVAPAPAAPAAATPASTPTEPTTTVAAGAGASASSPSAATSGGYEITVASFRTEQRAIQVVNGLVESGHRAASRLDAGGAWYVVVVGPFASADDAQSAQATLARNGFAGTRIRSRP